MAYNLQKIVIYPVKSLGGIALPLAAVGERGLEHDRRYMLADEHGVFISQRKFPQLSQIKMMMVESGFKAFYRSKHESSEIIIPFEPLCHGQIKVSIWEDVCDAWLCDNIFSEFFSDFLKCRVRLIYLPDDSIRPYEIPGAASFGITSLADAYPMLLVGTASLEDLNSKLLQPVEMDRFRPNLVIETKIPFEEDLFGHFSIGAQQFISIKQCSRCVMTTIDSRTGLMGKEPLTTLSQFRSFNHRIMFGMNVAAVGDFGFLTVGDQLNRLSEI